LTSGPDDSVLYTRALELVGAGDRPGVYWAGRALLVRRPAEIATYDEVFRSWWDGRPAPDVATDSNAGESVVLDDLADDAAGALASDRPDVDETLAVRYSAREVLREKDFAACTPAELDEVHRLIAEIRTSGPRRRSRRHRPTSSRRAPAARLDLRRTARRAIATGGEPIDRRYTRAAERPRRIVLLCDISGSMDAYTRSLLRFVHTAVVGGRSVEAFALGTRLTRLTRELSLHDPDAAMRHASTAVEDWSGGTRLGECLATFNDRWGARGMARGAVVVILSDGWDRGDPALLARQMERLGRLAHRIVWVNPLEATPGYQPLAAGMAAALPYVDRFVSGHSVAALDDLAAALAE
jgi:hypothetical protein